MKPNLRKLIVVMTVAAAGLAAAAEAPADSPCVLASCIPEPQPITEPACFVPCLFEDIVNIVEDVERKCCCVGAELGLKLDPSHEHCGLISSGG